MVNRTRTHLSLLRCHICLCRRHNRTRTLLNSFVLSHSLSLSWFMVNRSPTHLTLLCCHSPLPSSLIGLASALINLCPRIRSRCHGKSDSHASHFVALSHLPLPSSLAHASINLYYRICFRCHGKSDSRTPDFVALSHSPLPSSLIGLACASLCCVLRHPHFVALSHSPWPLC